MIKFLKKVYWAFRFFLRDDIWYNQAVYSSRADRFSSGIEKVEPTLVKEVLNETNPLRKYFNSHNEGPGIWKWGHYFDIYHRHFQKFRNKQVHILEIGVYSGGSLEMWKHYFGEQCVVYGVDIKSECLAYEKENIKIFIGDQSSPLFWDEFKRQIPKLDIVIDDGGHETDQQVITLEKIFDHMNPESVYICEDVHGVNNGFIYYTQALLKRLNYFAPTLINGVVASEKSALQTQVSSTHTYPFVFVIEKGGSAEPHFLSPKQGTQWEPFL